MWIMLCSHSGRSIAWVTVSIQTIEIPLINHLETQMLELNAWYRSKI